MKYTIEYPCTKCGEITERTKRGRFSWCSACDNDRNIKKQRKLVPSPERTRTMLLANHLIVNYPGHAHRLRVLVDRYDSIHRTNSSKALRSIQKESIRIFGNLSFSHECPSELLEEMRGVIHTRKVDSI